jgi:hypothetical protein
MKGNNGYYMVTQGKSRKNPVKLHNLDVVRVLLKA